MCLPIVKVLSPLDISEKDLLVFEEMVLKSGEVNPQTLPDLIQNAYALAFIWMDGALIGVGGVKRPSNSYRADVFLKAKVAFDPSQFEFELGWIYIEEAGRDKKIASLIVEKLVLALDGANAYATSSVVNYKMHASLRRFGFELVGTPYASSQNASDIILFLRK